MKCFYHVDQDGIVSGFYVRKACEQRGLEFKPEDFRKINYGMKQEFDVKNNNNIQYAYKYYILYIVVEKELKHYHGRKTR